MLYLALATISFILNWLFLRKRVLQYAIIASMIYLVSFVFIRSFDVLYVEYALFLIIPHIKDFRRMSVLHFAFVAYIFAELAVALLHEPLAPVAATFFTRFFPLIFVNYINKKREIIPIWSRKYEQKLLRITVICEAIILMLLYLRGNGKDFLVVSHQPVGGNISLAGVFLAMDIAQHQGTRRRLNRTENIGYLIFFATISLISGIRGYIIVILPCAFYGIFCYLVDREKRKIGLFLTGTLAVGFILIAYFGNGRLVSFFRSIDTSIGYRKLENQFFFQTMINSNPIRWFLGYGIGASGDRMASTALVHALVKGSKYYFNHLIQGATFLNFWTSIIKDTGIIGFYIYIYLYYNLIPYNLCRDSEIKKGWFLYAILYAFMLIYRLSCTNGLLELYVLTMVTNADTNEEMQYESRDFLNEQTEEGVSGHV